MGHVLNTSAGAASQPAPPVCCARCAGAPWTDWVLSEYFTAVRKLLEQPETRGERLPAGAAGRPATPEPVGLYTESQTTHQAP